MLKQLGFVGLQSFIETIGFSKSVGSYNPARFLRFLLEHLDSFGRVKFCWNN